MGDTGKVERLVLDIRNLAYRGWEDRPNAEFLFREIGKKAQQIAETIGAPTPAPTPEGDKMASLMQLISAWIKSESGPTQMGIYIPELQTKVSIRGYKKIILERDFTRQPVGGVDTEGRADD